MYFDSYATGKRIQQLRKTNGMTQEEMAIRLNISDRHLGRIERGECAASIDLMVEVVVLLKATLDFLIIGVIETPRERELIAHIKKQNKTIRMFKQKLHKFISQKPRSDSRLLFSYFSDAPTKNRTWDVRFLYKKDSFFLKNRT